MDDSVSTTRREFMAAAGAAGLAFAQQQTKPNIVFILADDLGYAHVGCYGQKDVQTPNIDRLAAEGLRFTSAYSGCTVCAPSRSTLMTGQHTGHTRVRGNRRPEVPLRPEDTTVAELLKKVGYRNGIFGKWGLGPAETGGIPNKKGFDDWFGYLDQVHAHNYWTDALWDNKEEYFVIKNQSAKKGAYSHDLIADRALKFIEESKGKPFFLYAPFTLPHGNFDPPSDAPYSKRDWPQDIKDVAAMITRLDKSVGDIMAALKKNGLDDNTLVIFTSDNGPLPKSREYLNASGIYRGAKRDVYEGGIRVPFVARWPGRIRQGVTDQPIAFWDFLPTACELTGVAAPRNIDGISYLPTLFGKGQQKQHDYFYWEFHERGFSQGIRMGDWKGIRLDQGKPLEVYNLKDDPSEKNNVAAKEPTVVAKLEKILAGARTPSEHWPEPRKSRPVEK